MRKSWLAVLVTIVLSPLPLLAHHGWGGNEDKISEVTGAVTVPVSLAGPHATMKIKDADGHVWDVTLAPPARTSQSGLTEGTIPLGAMVVAHGHRNKNQKTFEIKATKLRYNGKLYDVYPGMD